jgi:hypothetical protein
VGLKILGIDAKPCQISSSFKSGLHEHDVPDLDEPIDVAMLEAKFRRLKLD